MRKIITLSLLSLMALSAMAEDIKTLIYTPTPVMTCQNCEKKIKSSVRFVKGTKRIETSLKDQTVTITYDADKAKPEDYVQAFAKIGRKVEEVSADKKAVKVANTADKEVKKAEKQAVKVANTADKEVKKAEKQAVKVVNTADKEIQKAEKKAVKAEKTVVTPKKK